MGQTKQLKRGTTGMCFAVAGCLGIAVILGLVYHRSNRRIGASEAGSLALIVTGVKDLGRIEKTTLVTTNEVNIPFIGKKLAGRLAYEVTIDVVRLKLPSANPESKDNCTRKFRVLLDARTGQILLVTSAASGLDWAMTAVPSGKEAEGEMRDMGEIYLGIPTKMPKIALLQALDSTLDYPCHPYYARGIHAVCVLRKWENHEPKAIWAITLNGIPLLPTGGPGVPDWQRNHMRILVDAETGKSFHATTVPQPEGPASEEDAGQKETGK